MKTFTQNEKSLFKIDDCRGTKSEEAQRRSEMLATAIYVFSGTLLLVLIIFKHVMDHENVRIKAVI